MQNLPLPSNTSVNSHLTQNKSLNSNIAQDFSSSKPSGLYHGHQRCGFKLKSDKNPGDKHVCHNSMPQQLKVIQEASLSPPIGMC